MHYRMNECIIQEFLSKSPFLADMDIKERLPLLIPPLGINGGGGEAASSLYKISEVSL